MARFMKVEPEAILPKRGTLKSAGYDLYSNEYLILKKGTSKLVKTGVTIELADDQYLAVVPRSGLALKHGITVLNTPGTVDADYFPGEIGVILYNTSNKDYEVLPGERIAQGIISHYDLLDIDNVENQERAGGFGSTGKE